MFRKSYVGWHGFNTFVQGTWVIDGDEYSVRVTRIGRPDDEFTPGEVYSLEEIVGITEGDVFAYAAAAERYAVA
jgi:hypothetical protein